MILWAGSVLLAWVVPGVVGLAATGELHRLSQRIEVDGEGLGMARELELAMLAVRREELLWRATGESEHLQQRDAHRALAASVAGSLRSYVHTAQGGELLGTVQEKLNVLRGQSESSAAMPPESLAQTMNEMLTAANRLSLHERDRMEETVWEANHLQAVVSYWMLGLSVGTAAMLFIGSPRIIRRVTYPVRVLAEAAKALGKGDLSARASILHDDELGALARAFNDMAADMAERQSRRLQFVAIVAHDLKNPVLTIEMAGRLLRDASPNEEQRPYVDAVIDEATRLRVTLRDLMDDLQVASGRLTIRKNDVELGSLVGRLVQTQARAVTDHELVADTQECRIIGDARRLERDVSNLVSNAVKYSPCNTRIMVRVEKRDSVAVLSVSDQGPGVAEEDLQAIFEPFGRGRTADGVAEGAGIGLYVVKQVVEAHDGQVEVYREPGRGTTFLVTLPLAQMSG